MCSVCAFVACFLQGENLKPVKLERPEVPSVQHGQGESLSCPKHRAGIGVNLLWEQGSQFRLAAPARALL